MGTACTGCSAQSAVLKARFQTKNEHRAEAESNRIKLHVFCFLSKGASNRPAFKLEN